MSAMRACAGSAATRACGVRVARTLPRAPPRRLCEPVNKLGGIPFRPVKATAVDMFPHTAHIEMVVAFERG